MTGQGAGPQEANLPAGAPHGASPMPTIHATLQPALGAAWPPQSCTALLRGRRLETMARAQGHARQPTHQGPRMKRLQGL